MDKSEGKDWFAKTLNNVTEETAKVYKISRLKFETSTLTKSKQEKLSVVARKLMQYVDEGKIDAKLFEPEYSAIVNIEKKKADINQEMENIKNNLKIGFGSKRDNCKDDDDDDVIKIVDSQKVDLPKDEPQHDDDNKK